MSNKEKESTSFHENAREFVEKLMRIEQHLIRKYSLANHKGIINAMTQLKIGFDIYNTRTDEGMRKYWIRFREAIKYCIPGRSYSGYETLKKEFERLDEADVWNTVTNSLR